RSRLRPTSTRRSSVPRPRKRAAPQPGAALLVRAGVLLVTAALATAACTVGPSQRPPVAVRGDGSVVVDPSATGTPGSPAVPLPPLELPGPGRTAAFAPCRFDPLSELGQ